MMKRIVLLVMICLVWLTAMADRPKIGLVLGGGGAKGAAEVGVLKVLERTGVKPDYIVGTSIGAIVGGLYAAGYSASELDTLFRTQEWLSLLTDRNTRLGNEPYVTENGVTYIFGFPILDRATPGFGMMRGGRVERVLDSMFVAKGCSEFAGLKTPFRCVAADIRSAKEVVLKQGKVSKALRASMAIPGVFKPVEKDGTILVDGGMLNNLPVDLCRKMGADIVIAVDLQQREKTPKKPADLSLLTGLTSLLGLGDIVEWMANRPDIQRYIDNREDADIYIHPDLGNLDISSFGNKNMAKMIRLGELAANAHLQELCNLRR